VNKALKVLREITKRCALVLARLVGLVANGRLARPVPRHLRHSNLCVHRGDVHLANRSTQRSGHTAPHVDGHGQHRGGAARTTRLEAGAEHVTSLLRKRDHSAAQAAEERIITRGRKAAHLQQRRNR